MQDAFQSGVLAPQGIVAGIFVVGVVVFGSLLIMYNLNANMMPTNEMMQMQP